MRHRRFRLASCGSTKYWSRGLGIILPNPSRECRIPRTSGGGSELGRLAPGAFRRTRLIAVQRRIVTIQRRAIGADRLTVVAYIDENMRVIERRRRPDAHEFPGADLDRRHPRIVVKMRDNLIRHGLPASSCSIGPERRTIASTHGKA